MTAPLLETRGLTKHFKVGGSLSRKTLHAVDDADLVIGRREIVALVGESGSGKSTIARLLARVYRPTGRRDPLPGPAAVGACARAGRRLAYRGDVPMVFQDPFSSLNPAYRVSHGILRGLKLHRPELNRAQRHGRGRAGRRGGRAHARRPRSSTASRTSCRGGQRQRIGFAQALAYRPKLILADEPVSMLDVSIRIGLLNLMAQLRERARASRSSTSPTTSPAPATSPTG